MRQNKAAWSWQGAWLAASQMRNSVSSQVGGGGWERKGGNGSQEGNHAGRNFSRQMRIARMEQPFFDCEEGNAFVKR